MTHGCVKLPLTAVLNWGNVTSRLSSPLHLRHLCGFVFTYGVVDVMVGSLILGRTMRDNRDDDEADATIGDGAGAVAVAPPSSVLHASPFGVSNVGSPESTSFSGDAASALGVSSPPISTSAQAAVPKRKFSLVLCFCMCLMCATRMASELPTGVPR